VQQRKFKNEKDAAIAELNQKYVHPVRNFCMMPPKKPILIAVKDEDREKHGLPEGELRQRDIVRAQDESRKKGFVKYFKWKHGLYNEDNLLDPLDTDLVMVHDEEYKTCCIKQVLEQQGGDSNNKAKKERISSAHSRYANSRHATNSKT